MGQISMDINVVVNRIAAVECQAGLEVLPLAFRLSEGVGSIHRMKESASHAF